MKEYYLTAPEYEYLDHLAVRAQRGDNDARSALYRALYPIVESWIEHRFWDSDLRQEAYVLVWMRKIPKVIRAFRYRKNGLRFYSYLSRCVLRALDDVGKTERRRSQMAIFPQDIQWGCERLDDQSALDLLLSRETLKEIGLYGLNHLESMDRRILNRLLDGHMTQEQLAKEFGVSKSCVSKREARIRRKLSAHLAAAH